MGNNFQDNSKYLVILDTRDTMDAFVGETMRNAEMLVKEQYKEFVDEGSFKARYQ